ncbi:hypothetical protein J2Z44_001175 [Clostridium punense]|uniref:Uncharacterized protein n=1 Tax=Clostridium punense TaxID=1054297 RepID=A0ABS4K411_9CLOT|nr:MULTISPECIES: hypothetical protein [Clostridium]EQB86023.1 hypothetical protein M918_16380 [Clostridium sp. BL8]MBP2021379.1 hypothetical protein [Clostridium punense]
MKNVAYYFVKYNVLLIVLFLIDKFLISSDNLSIIRAVGIVIVVAIIDIIIFSKRKYDRLSKKGKNKQ